MRQHSPLQATLTDIPRNVDKYSVPLLHHDWREYLCTYEYRLYKISLAIH